MRLLNFVQDFLTNIQRHPRKPRAVRARQNTAATKRFRRLALESLEDRRVLANISVTSVQLADGNLNPITQAVVGEEIFVRVDYTTDALNANTSYRIAYTVDGVTLSHANITSGAGLASGSWNWSRAGWFAESTGTHNATVTLDADNTITETSELDNSASFSFTVVTATPPVQFSWPEPGVPFIDVSFSNYLDLDPTSGKRDWAGGQLTYDGHFGLDLGSFFNEGMDVGIPILAAAPGTVVEVEDGNFDRNYGTLNNITPDGPPNYIIINHGNGWRTRYYHLRRDSIRVQVGDVVQRGDHIAFEGSSGHSTRSHLHLDVEHNLQPVETFLDPTVYWQTPPPYVGSALYLNETGITNYNPVTPNDHFGERPSDVEVFSQASGQTVYAWGVYSGLRLNDIMQANFKRPDGSTFATNTYPIQSDWSTSNWYFIRPLPSVPDVGMWTVEYLVNGVELGSDTFLVTGTGAPEARLEETNGQIVLDGRYTPYDLGTVNVGAAGPNQAFRLVNHGSAPLVISGITLPNGFQLIDGLPTSLAPGASDTFTIGFSTATAGYFAGPVHITTNDSSESDYNFSVEGTVTGAASVLKLGISERHVREGSRLLANVRRSGSLASALTVNLSSGDTTEGTVPASVVIPAGKESANFFINAVYDGIVDANQSLAITASATGHSNARNVVEIEDLPTGFTITETNGTTAVSESGTTDSFQLVLTSQPTSNVVLNLVSGDTTEATVSPATVTFTPANWNVPRTVIVTGVNDAVIDGLQTAIVTVSVNDLNSDDDFDQVGNQTVTVTNTDNDIAGFSISQSGGTTSVSETGTTDTFSVVLTTQPTANVVITFHSDDTTEATVNTAALTFTPANWNTPQTVTVSGVNDSLFDGTQTTTVTAAVDDANSDDNFDPIADQSVSVTTTDDEIAGFSVIQSGGTTSIGETGTTDTLNVVLTIQPPTNVVLTVVSGDTTEASVSPALLTFTPANWNLAQTVTVTGANDPTVDGNQSAVITVAVDDANSDDNFDAVADQTVSVTTADDDVAGYSISQTGGTTSVHEGGTTDTFNVVLTAQPLANVEMKIISGDATEVAVNSDVLNFTPANWNVAQVVTVIGVNDDAVDGTQSSFITVAVNTAISDINFASLADQTVSVNTDDDDIPGFSLSQMGGTTSVSESGTIDPIDVVLIAQPLTDVVLTIVNNNPAEATVSPATLTFTPTNWNTTQTVMVTGVNDVIVDGTQTLNVTVSVDDASSDNHFDLVVDQTVSVTTTDDDIAGFSISQSGGGTTVGESGTTDTFGVQLLAQPQTVVVLTVASNKLTEATVSPTRLTFTPANWNSVQTVTVTGVNDATVDGTQTSTLTVAVDDASSDNHFELVTDQMVSVTTTDDEIAGFAITQTAGTTSVGEGGTMDSLDIALTAQPTTDVVITFVSGDTTEANVSPESWTFTPADWNVPRTVTVTGANDPTVDGTQSSLVTVAVDDANSDNIFDLVANQTVSVTTTDDDAAGFLITQTAGSNSVSETGTTDTFEVVLTAQPLTNVVLTFVSGDTTEATTSPAQWIFTPENWDVSLTVTVTGKDDLEVDGNQTTAVTVFVDDANSDNAFDVLADQGVLVTTDDDDVALDFGDAPTRAQSGFGNSYPTKLADDGARHVSGPLALGTANDLETDGQPATDADGDDANADDEDGVIFLTSMVTSAIRDMTASVNVIASQAGQLDAWIDFNRDGDWDDLQEQIFTNFDVVAQDNVLPFKIPSGSLPGDTYARFRISKLGRLRPTGLANDGEVEDYRVTIVESSTGANVDIHLPSPSTDVRLIDNDILVQNGYSLLFQGPVSSVATLTLFGTDEDDQLILHDMKAVFAGRFHVDLGAGSDTLFLADKDQTFDLVGSLKHVIRDVEFLDIRGTGNNTLSINSQTILDISEHSDTLVVLANLGDTVNIGSGWSLAGSQVDNGHFFRVLRNGTTQLLLHGPADHQNPFDRHDANADGTVVPIDALLVINELNSRSISNANGSVIDPATLTNFNNVFRDVNGDGFITPIDALLIINFLNARSGEAEGETNADDRNSSVPPVPPPVISLNVITLPEHSPNCLRVNRRDGRLPSQKIQHDFASQVDELFGNCDDNFQVFLSSSAWAGRLAET